MGVRGEGYRLHQSATGYWVTISDLRRHAYKLIDQGANDNEIMAETGVKKARVYEWRRNYRAYRRMMNGLSGLAEQYLPFADALVAHGWRLPPKALVALARAVILAEEQANRDGHPTNVDNPTLELLGEHAPELLARLEQLRANARKGS